MRGQPGPDLPREFGGGGQGCVEDPGGQAVAVLQYGQQQMQGTDGRVTQLAGLAFGGEDVVLAKGYGLADIATASSMDTGTVGPIGLDCKPYSALAAMQLRGKRAPDLDTPINRHLDSRSPTPTGNGRSRCWTCRPTVPGSGPPWLLRPGTPAPLSPSFAVSRLVIGARSAKTPSW